MADTLPDITHAEVLRRLEQAVAQYVSQAAAARAWSITEAYLSMVLSGKRTLGPKLLGVLGLRRVTVIVHRYAEADAPTVRTVRKVSPHH